MIGVPKDYFEADVNYGDDSDYSDDNEPGGDGALVSWLAARF